MIHLVALVTALVVGITAELIGIWRHKAGKVDTYTELVAWASHRVGYWFLPIMVLITGLMVWAIPHLWEQVLR